MAGGQACVRADGRSGSRLRTARRLPRRRPGGTASEREERPPAAHQVLPVGASVEAPRPPGGSGGCGSERLPGVVTGVNPPDGPGGRPTYDVSYDAGGPPGLSLPASAVRPAAWPPPDRSGPPRDVLGSRLVPRGFRSGQRDVMSAEEYAALANHAGLFREAHSEPGAVVSAPLSEVHPAMAAAEGSQCRGQGGRSGLNGRLEVAPSSELDGLRLFAVLDVGLAAERDPGLRRLVEGNLGRAFGLGRSCFRLDDALSMPDGGWPYDYAAVGIGTADDGDRDNGGRRGRLTSVRAVCLALVYRWGEGDAIDLPDLPHYTSAEGKPFVVTHLHVDSAIRGRGLGTYLIQCLQTLYRTLGRGRPKLLLAVDDTRDALGRWYDGRDVTRTRWEDNAPCVRHYAAYNGFAAAAAAGPRSGGGEGGGEARTASRPRNRAARKTAERSEPPTGTGRVVVEGTTSDSTRRGGDGQGIIRPRMTRNFTASRGTRHIHVRSPPAGEVEVVESCTAEAPGNERATSPTRRGGPKARPKRRREEAVGPPAKRHKTARLWSPKRLLLRIASECGGMLGRAMAMAWGDGKSLKPTKEVVFKIDK